MAVYEEYIGRLKGMKTEFDIGKMQAGIEAKITSRSRRKRLAMEGALAILLIGLALYYSFSPYLFGNGNTFAEYVYQPENMNGDQVLAYVFKD